MCISRFFLRFNLYANDISICFFLSLNRYCKSEHENQFADRHLLISRLLISLLFNFFNRVLFSVSLIFTHSACFNRLEL